MNIMFNISFSNENELVSLKNISVSENNYWAFLLLLSPITTNVSKSQSIFINTLPNPSIQKTFLEFLGIISISDFVTLKKFFLITFQPYFIYDPKLAAPGLENNTLLSHQSRLSA